MAEEDLNRNAWANLVAYFARGMYCIKLPNGIVGWFNCSYAINLPREMPLGWTRYQEIPADLLPKWEVL